MGILTYVGSRADAGADRLRSARRIAAAFFVGIVISLLVLGTVAAVVGRLVARWSGAFAVAAAIFSILAGIAALAGPLLRRHLHDPRIARRGGALGAFAYGLLYTVATLTTSAGPLMLLLTIAAAVGRPVYGAALALFYGIGRGLPFLLLGIFAGRAAGWIARLGRGARIAEVVSGIALVGVGIYFARLGVQLTS